MFCTSKVAMKSAVSLRTFGNFSASSLLREENRQNCMKRFKAMLVKQGSRQVKRKAAVLIPIYVNGDDVSLLYTLRAASLKTHRGQVSFPGGMEDFNDSTLEYTALRETEEELGISYKHIEVWGSGNFIIRQDLAVLPVIGCLSKNLFPNQFSLNTNEVEEVFTVKLQELCNPKLNTHTQFRRTYTTPVYFGGPYRIWGLTAVMTFMFLKAFLPSGMYKHQIPYIPEVRPELLKKKLQ